jgi:uncharacterized protein YqeY
MSLKEKILADIKSAMLEKNRDKRDALRLISSAIKQVEVDKRVELSDQDIIKLIQKMVKQRRDSIEQFISGSREDLANKEKQEIEFISIYLPQQLSDTELESKVKDIVTQVNATTIKDIGRVMGVASKELDGLAEGARISRVVKELLS